MILTRLIYSIISINCNTVGSRCQNETPISAVRGQLLAHSYVRMKSYFELSKNKFKAETMFTKAKVYKSYKSLQKFIIFYLILR